MSKKKPGEEDEVGYRKPPLAHQFKKGRSGNPKGRPRKTRHARPEAFGALAADMLRRHITVKSSDGTQSRMTYKEAILERQLFNLATGKKADLRQVLMLLNFAEEGELLDAKPFDSRDELRARIEKMVDNKEWLEEVAAERARRNQMKTKRDDSER